VQAVIVRSAHLSMLSTELPFAERPAAARRAGFRAVGSWWPPEDAAAGWALVESLASVGYDGAIGLEFDPRGATARSLAFLSGAPPDAPFPEPAVIPIAGGSDV